MIIWIVLTVVLVGIDMLTKYLAAAHLMGAEPLVVIPNLLELVYVENRGAAFGIFQDTRWVLVCITSVAMIAIAYYIIKNRKKNKMMIAFLSVIFAGGMGNMIERVWNGFVVDFIYLPFINFPCFNVADICVSVGSALLVIYILFFYQTESGETVWNKK